jgi:hypothetical protein
MAINDREHDVVKVDQSVYYLNSFIFKLALPFTCTTPLPIPSLSIVDSSQNSKFRPYLHTSEQANTHSTYCAV